MLALTENKANMVAILIQSFFTSKITVALVLILFLEKELAAQALNRGLDFLGGMASSQVGLHLPAERPSTA